MRIVRIYFGAKIQSIFKKITSNYFWKFNYLAKNGILPQCDILEKKHIFYSCRCAVQTPQPLFEDETFRAPLCCISSPHQWYLLFINQSWLAFQTFSKWITAFPRDSELLIKECGKKHNSWFLLMKINNLSYFCRFFRKLKKEKRNASIGPHPYRVSRARPAFSQPWLHGRGRGVSLDLIFDDGSHSAQRLDLFSLVCWTRNLGFKGPFLILFGLASGVLPHVPKMLPVLISDPEMRQKVEETFTSQEFMDNLENYFVENIKVNVIVFERKSYFLELWKRCTYYSGNVSKQAFRSWCRSISTCHM